MNTNKLPNLGSTGWGKSLNDYIKGIETRVSDIEHGLNEITIEGISWDISSGVVGFNGRMMRVASGSDLNPDERVIDDGQEITSYRNPNQFFWKGEVFFKDIGNGTSVYKTIDDDGEAYWDIKADPDTGWTPVYLKIGEFGEGLSYLKDNENAYLTHPFVILLGFIFYDGEKIYWHYKTSKSDESTYAKRFMLTRPLAKFNSTFDVKSNGGRSYTITGKQTGNKNPILTLNAMGINYYDSNLTDESLKKGPDYKEFEISTDTPVISYISGSSVYYTNSTFTTPNTLNKRYIHRVFFSNAGRYVLQSEQYDSDKGTDFSTVVSYGFDNIYPNFERYGDLVEIFRFVTEGTESSNNLVKVYQVIGSGIPPVDSFGVVPEINYISREGSNNIQFTDSNNNYFTLVGQNYVGTATPKVVRLNFNHSNSNYNYHALMNYTDISTTNGILFKGGLTTSYTFSTTDLDLKMSNDRYIRMGTAGRFSDGIELKNSDGSIAINNDGIINLRHGNNKSLQLGSAGVQLMSGSSSLFLGDDDNGNVVITMNNDINLDAPGGDINLDSDNNIRLISPSTGILSNRITLQNNLENTVIFENGELYGYYVGNVGENKWWLNSDHGYFSGLKVGNDSYKLVFLENTNLVTEHVPNAGVYWKVNSEENGKKYLLNNFPILGKQAFGATISWRVGNTNNERYGYWYGNFPLIFFSPDAEEKSVGMARSQEHPEHVWLTFLASDGYLMPAPENLKVRVNNFTGWAWEVIGI